MDVKELLFIVSVALLVSWTVDYFFMRKKTVTYEEAQSGQSFVAPKNMEDVKPVNTQINFGDLKRSRPALETEIETDHAKLIFSTDGAALTRLEFKRIDEAGVQHPLTTIYPLVQADNHKKTFLVAFDKETPYYYRLIANDDKGEFYELSYEAEWEGNRIAKIFTVHKKNYRIDLEVRVIPFEGITLEPRIFFAAPIMQEIAADDVKSGVMTNERNAVITTPRSSINVDMFWKAPTFFGADNRYFAHVMVSDADRFARRAYFKLEDHNDLTVVIEGPSVQAASGWKTSYYFGPKESHAMRSVDNRLEGTLAYAGWLAPISRILLMLLVFIYGFLGNYGLAIIALTLLIRLLLLPFSIKGTQGLKRKQELDRKLKYLQQKYRDNREMLTQERNELLRQEGMTGLFGCLPLLLQLPVAIALNRVLSSSIELYDAPFYGWITDLSAKDPYYVLPVLIFVSMLAIAGTVDASQRLQTFVMALIFAAVSANFSAGLCLYILVSTVLGFVQSAIQKHPVFG